MYDYTTEGGNVILACQLFAAIFKCIIAGGMAKNDYVVHSFYILALTYGNEGVVVTFKGGN